MTHVHIWKNKMVKISLTRYCINCRRVQFAYLLQLFSYDATVSCFLLFFFLFLLLNHLVMARCSQFGRSKR